MESAGKYWIPVWNVLEDSFHVVISNPIWVSSVKGNKDDKKDSKLIGDLFRRGIRYEQHYSRVGFPYTSGVYPLSVKAHVHAFY